MITKNDLQKLCRSALDIIGERELLEKIKSGRKLRIKLGIDPTGADLHLGHTVSLFAIRRFQELGHTAVILFGDFTARIGDPTDKLAVRKPMALDDIQKNIASLQPQILKVLHKENLEFRGNAEWWENMKLEEFLNIAKHVSANHLFERDMFQERAKQHKPIWIHEFLYPILQGYDSVKLSSDLTIIGNDQKFNELMARPFQQLYQQEPQAVITMPILVGTDGVEKMGKSLNNYIGLNDAPNDMFGKLMTVADSAIITYYLLLTDVSEQEITEIKKKIAKDPRKEKEILAHRLTSFFCGAQAADVARDYFNNTFSKKITPNEITEFKISIDTALKITDLLVKIKWADSASDAKRLIREGAISVNDTKITDIVRVVKKEDLPVVLKKGKRHFIKVIL